MHRSNPPNRHSESKHHVILNLFQDLSAEKDKKRLAVRCWNKFSMTFGVICYLYSHFGEANSILLSNPKTHGSLLITHYSKSVSSACQWKSFTKAYSRINPAGKSKVPSWKIFISQLENYFFSVGKSKFRSRAILGDFLGLFLNYFKRFLFILTLMYTLWTKVKMFDSERWAMSDELRVMSFRLDRRTKGHVFYCRVTDPYTQKQRITYSP